MRVDNKQGAGIPKDEPVAQATPSQPAKKGRGRPSKSGQPSAYMQKKYGTQGKTQSSTGKVVAKTIHSIILLDNSTSMNWGDKFKAAIQGMSLNHRALGFEVAENPGLSYVLTYMLFGYSGNEQFIYKGTPYQGAATKDLDWSNRQRATDGSTALYDAIYTAGEYVKSGKVKSDKTLINIFTDGQENSSRGPITKYKGGVKAYIKDLETNYGCTITFVGTESDVKEAVRGMGVHESNTLSYDGTGAGMSASMTTNSVSRSAYSKSVLQGEDVSLNFYSKDVK